MTKNWMDNGYIRLFHCGVENEYTEGFGDGETCKNCGTVHECDFECDYDNLYHWVIGIKEAGCIK